MSRVIRNNTSGEIQLSPHFYLTEFTHSDTAERAGVANVPNPLVVQNLFRLAALMEQVRKLLGDKVVLVSSGYRSPEVNALVRGSANSDHLRGEACDFVCRGFGTPLQVARAIAQSSIAFGQLIQEGSWVHISLPDGVNDRQVMTAKFAPDGVAYVGGL